MTGSADFPKGRVSLLLEDIGEPAENDLRIVVVEAKPGAPEMTEVGEARPVKPDETSRRFELIWYCYVAYVVRNESYARVDGEALGDDRLQIRTNSAFLAYVAAATLATDDYPGPLTHWSLYTEWQCIDVVSVDPPEIRLLPASEASAGPKSRNRVFTRLTNPEG
ncbi:hypothetical protein QO010_000245 [Caulobacter ginsengisoli]|uniref:Uncharacterized protein n=1 Tax=Caulobacter ginsengisoli TaxID=400775 RepID=A0ABU0INF3_9CAUL|nr:hypothetical protein [Caulobacter ginsengisoli]MDQ0462497.1 hypothetical protein [Caulobacter ginsengisoli]